MKKSFKFLLLIVLFFNFKLVKCTDPVINELIEVRQETPREKFLAEQKIKYDKAIQDAKVTRVNEVCKNLIPINPWNKDLIFNKGKTHILVASFMGEWAADNFFKPNLGKSMQIKYSTWITVVPQVKEAAKRFRDQIDKKGELTLTDRINQYLGLPLNNDKKFFVEAWVKPEDMFRPCADGEIVDQECYPDAVEDKLPKSFQGIFKFIPATKEHQNWFNSEKQSKYYGDNPFPWTRLGYTFDWGSDNEIGASEFGIKLKVIPAEVIIRAIIPADEYPDFPSPKSDIEIISSNAETETKIETAESDATIINGEESTVKIESVNVEPEAAESSVNPVEIESEAILLR